MCSYSWRQNIQCDKLGHVSLSAVKNATHIGTVAHRTTSKCSVDLFSNHNLGCMDGAGIFKMQQGSTYFVGSACHISVQCSLISVCACSVCVVRSRIRAEVTMG